MAMKKIIITLLAILITCECKEVKRCFSEKCKEESKEIRELLDTSIDPCDDFYMFACGISLNGSNTDDEQPPVSEFMEKYVKVRTSLMSAFAEDIEDEELDPFTFSKIFFQGCIFQDEIEEEGLEPMKKVINSVGGWPVVDGSNWTEVIWQYVFGNLTAIKQINAKSLFDVKITTDLMNSKKRVIEIDQFELGLDRKYLMKGVDDEKVQAYGKYQVETAILFGADNETAEAEMKEVLDFEIELAKLAIPDEDRKNKSLQYNRMKVKDLKGLIPIFNWSKYLNKLLNREDITRDEKVIVTDFKNIAEDVYDLLNRTSNRVIVNYLIWRATQSVAVYLNSDMRAANLKFESVINGKEDYGDRTDECYDLTLKNLPLETSIVYARSNKVEDEHNKFEPSLKYLQSAIKTSFKEILKTSEWMDDVTRAKALAKLKTIKFLTYHVNEDTEEILDEIITKYYDKLEMNEKDFFNSLLTIKKFYAKKNGEKYRRDYVAGTWNDLDRLANVKEILKGILRDLLEEDAFINKIHDIPLRILPIYPFKLIIFNLTLVIPLGIFANDFFEYELPKFAHYGPLGAEIGQIIINAVSRIGSEYDEQGNYLNWWSEETKHAYEEKTQCFVDQYGSIRDNMTGLNLNGVDTKERNINDNAGIRVAYDAYMAHIKFNKEEGRYPKFDYSTRKLFFIYSTLAWCQTENEDYVKQLIESESIPNSHRVNIQLMNMPEFAEAFNCPVNSTMNPEKKCRVW